MGNKDLVKKSKTRVILTAVLISILVVSAALVAYAVASLVISQNVNWNYQKSPLTFTVNGTSALNDLSLGTITDSGTQTISYNVMEITL